MENMDDKVIRLVSSRKDEGEPADDVVLMLRKLADDIENGEYGSVEGICSIMVTDNDIPYELFSWGKDYRTIADAHFYFVKAANLLQGIA